MALKKFTAELLLTKGIEQKVPEQVIPDESLTTALNVDFSKVGAARKRQGFVTNSNLVLRAGIMDETRRLGSRKHREVLCVTETVTQIGSSAGIGNAGDTVFSYSEQAERWVVRGKMPRPNVDVVWKSGVLADDTMSGVIPGFSFVVGGIQNYVCMAYRAKSQSGIYVMRVVVLDVGGDVSAPLREGYTVILDTSFQTIGDPVGWVTAGDKVWLVLNGPSGTGLIESRAYAFRFADLTFDTVHTVIDANDPVLAIASDGTEIYMVTRQGGAETDYQVRKYTQNLSLLVSINDTGAPMARQEVSMDVRLGVVDVVRHDTTAGNVYVSRFAKGTLTQLLASTFVSAGEASGIFDAARGSVQICSVNGNDAVVMWANQNTSNVTEQPTYISIGLVRMTTGAVLGYFSHQGLVPYTQPFLFDGRCYFVAMRTTGYIHPNASPSDLSGSVPSEEAFVCIQVPLDNMNPYNVPFTCAQWRYGQTQTKTLFQAQSTNGTFWAKGGAIYQTGSHAYVLTNVVADAGQGTADTLPLPELVRLEFGDAVHRWRSVDFHDSCFFAGGLLTTYDGDRSYEAATSLHAPAILSYGRTLGGSLTADIEYQFQVVTLYTDANGRECWGVPSQIVRVTPTGADLAAYVNFAPPRLSMKPDLGNEFIGRLKVYLFMANQNDTQFVAAGDPYDVDPLHVGHMNFTIAFNPPSDAVRMYTAGFELDNWPPPPCRSICSHNGRLFVIGDDDNQVWYSKPARADRGVEFALQQVIPLAERGTALASLGDRLVIFTNKAIYAVQGDGPDVTGSPPDGFSRPLLISPDYGCVEYCAVGRTPMGVMFRGEQGFYLLTQGFSVEYIGGSVEDITSQWESTRAIVHDQETGCCRVIGWTGSESQELCFWYDTKRWSLNSLATSDDYSVVDAIMMGNNLLEATTDKSVAVVSRYRLGTRATAPGYQDYSNDYDQVVETGWISFNHVGSLKRFYRAIVFLRPLGSAARVQIQVYKDWETEPSSEREFQISDSDLDVRALRVHLKEQKIKSAKIRVTVSSEGSGVELLKLGFEMGMKQMATKEKREWSQ